MTRIFDEVVSVLAPGVGESLARASVDMHLRKIGLERDTLGPQHLGELVKALQPGLAVFVGKEDATALGDKVLGLAAGARTKS